MIQYKITLSKEELERYLQGEEKVEIEICNENDEIIEKKTITKRINKNTDSRKRKRNEEELGEKELEVKKTKRENKLEKFIQELSSQIDNQIGMKMEEQGEEDNDVRKLVEKYHDLGDMNSRMIWKWYYYGQSVQRKREEMKNQGKRKKKSNQTIKKDLYDQMMEILVTENIDEESKQNKREALKSRTKRAMRIYKLFIEIGSHNINKVKETSVSMISSVTKEEKGQIVKHLEDQNNK